MPDNPNENSAEQPIVMGPVQWEPRITDLSTRFTYVVERYYMDVRDKARVTAKGKPYAEDGYKTFQNTHTWLKKFAETAGEADLGQISDAWLKQFLSFLYTQPLSLNTVVGHINNVHSILNALILEGSPLKALTIRVWPEDSQAIYNPVAELKKILKADYSHETLELTRDIFIIQSNIGFRHGSLKRFLKKPELFLFKEAGRWFIRIVTNKTKEPVVVPVKKIVHKILKKRNYEFPPIYYETYYNSLIKVMAREAGLDEMIFFTKTIGGKPVEFVRPKYELMSSHTARRNFITNAFLAGVPVDILMKITGHRTREAFMKYVRVSNLAMARVIADHEFFE